MNLLLKKDTTCKWSSAAQQAFDSLKHALSQNFIIETDVSHTRIGAVLVQNGHPIAYISKMFAPQHQSLSAYDREMFAILLAVKKWEQYLMGRHFIIRTDNQPLKFLIEQKLTTPSQYTWLEKLMAYDYEIQYKPGKTNIVVDALSRVYSSEVGLHALSTISIEFLRKVKASWQDDQQLEAIIQTRHQRGTFSSYSRANEQLRWKGRLVVGQEIDL